MLRIAGLILAGVAVGLPTSGCNGDEDAPVELSFAAVVGDSAAACGTSYPGIGAGQSSAELADARLLVSGIELQRFSGDWVALALDQDSDWQHAEVALLDFEDGTGACADSGTSETNSMIRGTAPLDDYRGLRLTVGVPFELNHNDSARAPAPLNTPGMFWTWRGGYKFVRVDWRVSGGAVPRWNVHIGSTGCTSDGDTAPPDGPCDRANTAEVVLTDVDPTAQAISIDLGALVGGADLGANLADTPPGCMSAPTEPGDCSPVFGALGIDFSTGSCADGCVDQVVFAEMR